MGADWLGLSLCAYLLGISDYDPLPHIPPAAHAAHAEPAQCPGYADLAGRAPGGGASPRRGAAGACGAVRVVPLRAGSGRRRRLPERCAPDADESLYDAVAGALGETYGQRLLRGCRTHPLSPATARAYVRRYEEERNTALREVVGARVAAALAKGYRMAEYDRRTVLVDLGETPDLPLLPLPARPDRGRTRFCILISQATVCTAAICAYPCAKMLPLSALRLLERDTGIACASISFSDAKVYDYVRESGAGQEDACRTVPLLSSRAQLEAAAALAENSFAQFVRIFEMEGGDSPLAQARALERAVASYRLLWFRLHEPGAFFSAYFSAYGEDLDFDLLQNPGALERLLRNRSVAEDGPCLSPTRLTAWRWKCIGRGFPSCRRTLSPRIPSCFCKKRAAFCCRCGLLRRLAERKSTQLPARVGRERTAPKLWPAAPGCPGPRLKRCGRRGFLPIRRMTASSPCFESLS